MVSDPNLLSEFATESLEHLETAEPLLLEMEKRGEGDPELLNEIFRAIHSIKGAAGFLGLENISGLSHALESLLMRLRDGEFDFRPAMADPLLRGIDALRRMLNALPESEGDSADTLIASLSARGARQRAPWVGGRAAPIPSRKPAPSSAARAITWCAFRSRCASASARSCWRRWLATASGWPNPARRRARCSARRWSRTSSPKRWVSRPARCARCRRGSRARSTSSRCPTRRARCRCTSARSRSISASSTTPSAARSCALSAARSCAARSARPPSRSAS